MNFNIYKNKFRIPVDKNKIAETAGLIANDYGKKIDSLGIIILSDDKLLEINKKYLNHDDFTDIITFNYSEEEKMIDGELYISINRVRENAKKYSKTIENEINRVIIHGILHLMGEDDKTKEMKKNMTEKENIYMNKIKGFT